LDSLGNKGLAAYLIAEDFALGAESNTPKRATPGLGTPLPKFEPCLLGCSRNLTVDAGSGHLRDGLLRQVRSRGVVEGGGRRPV
jgi:hypothetical protein